MALTKVTASLVNLDGGVVINESSADADFRVESNDNANALFVDGGNNVVGIGTNTPAIASGNAGLVIHSTTGGTGSTGASRLRFTNTTTGQASTDGFEFSLDGNTNNFYIENRESTGNTIFYHGSEKMRIDASGDVGIGTSSPNISSSALALTLASSTEPCLELQGTRSSEGNTGMIRFYNSSDQIGVIQMRRMDANNTGDMSFYTSNAGSLTEKVRIAASGNVGIQTTDAGNAKLVINGAIGSGADTACIDFDGYGTYSEGSSQSINFRMGRTGQATDQAAQIRSIFQGGGATAGQTSVGFEFRCISNDTVDTTVRFSGTGQRIQFNTDEIPQSGNPITNQAIVIGESSSGAITQGLTNATVLQNRSGELYAIDSSHNNTQITPHNWGLISSGPSEELAWTYYSQRPNPSNSEQMQTINCDMAKVIRKVEDLVGEKLIYTENSDKDGHTFQTIISDIQTTLADLKTRVEALEG